MEKLITNLQQTYCTRNSYYMMSIINQFREKAPDLCINYLFFSFRALCENIKIFRLDLYNLGIPTAVCLKGPLCRFPLVVVTTSV